MCLGTFEQSRTTAVSANERQGSAIEFQSSCTKAHGLCIDEPEYLLLAQCFVELENYGV